jgi:uncharacterized protein YjgD (DUF1641 family)
MSEAVILERLDKLSDDVRSMKFEILEEIQQEYTLVAKQPPSDVSGFLQEVDADYSSERLSELVRTLLSSLEEFNEVARAVKAGVELKDDLGPVVRQVYPKSIEFFNDLDGDFHIDEVVILLRKALTNLDTVGEGLDMLRAGVELRDDLVPILQLMYPRLLRFLNSLHEGEFQAEKIGDLLHTILLNIHTLSDLLNMLQPMTELVKELGVVMRETDVLNGLNIWLDGLQQGSGLVRLAGTFFSAMKRLDFNDQQIEGICRVVEGLDFAKSKPLGPIGLIKQMNDPQVQQAFGFFFTIMQAVGGCLQTYNSKQG